MYNAKSVKKGKFGFVRKITGQQSRTTEDYIIIYINIKIKKIKCKFIISPLPVTTNHNILYAPVKCNISPSDRDNRSCHNAGYYKTDSIYMYNVDSYISQI